MSQQEKKDSDDTMTREELFAMLGQLATEVAKVCRDEGEGCRVDMPQIASLLLAMEIMHKASRDAWLFGKTPVRGNGREARK